MDKTNKVVKICRKIEELEYSIACGDMLPNDEDAAKVRLDELVEELESVHIAPFTKAGD